MKKAIILVLCLVSVGSMSTVSYASDWDKAGKVFAVIEGMRVLTGGRVDVIGNVAGINNQPKYASRRPQQNRVAYHKVINYNCQKSVWVPHFKYERKYVPKHEENHNKYGNIIVEAHYIRYQVESGGHWEQRDYCD